MTEQERKLLRLLEVVMDADKTALADVKTAIAELEQDVTYLRRTMQRSDFGGLGWQAIAQATRHNSWLEKQITEKMIEISKLMVRRNEAEDTLRISFGRFNALRMHLEDV